MNSLFILGSSSGFGGGFSDPGSVGALIGVERSGRCTGLDDSPRLDLGRTALVGLPLSAGRDETGRK